MLAVDIFFAAIDQFELVNAPGTQLPDGLRRFAKANRFTITDIMSVKQARHGKDKTRSLLGIVFRRDSVHASALKAALEVLCVQQGNTLRICGKKVEISLHPVVEWDTEERNSTFAGIADRNKALTAGNKVVVENVRLSSGVLSARITLPQIAAGLSGCVGIIPQLRHGRNDPRFTFILTYGLEWAFMASQPAELTAYIVKHFQRLGDLAPTPLPAIAINTVKRLPFSKPARPQGPNIANNNSNAGGGRGRGMSGKKHNRRRDRSTGGRNYQKPSDLMPQRSPVSNNWHAIVNGAGGISGATVIQGHFDQDRIRDLVHGVSHCMYWSCDLFPLAFNVFCNHHLHIKTMEDIDFMNRHAPKERSHPISPIPASRFDCWSVNTRRTPAT